MLLHKLSQEVRRIHEKTLRTGEPGRTGSAATIEEMFVFDKIDVATTGFLKDGNIYFHILPRVRAYPYQIMTEKTIEKI